MTADRPGGGRQRLDALLVSRGLYPTRSRAAAAILAGEVSVGGAPAAKAGQQVAGDADIEVRAGPRYVSRGGLKLERAFQVFSLDAAGRVALDAGASTGGFTDCLLQHGARRVIAVDVGYGQLDWRLRQDERVTVLERRNLRYLEPRELPESPSLATLDLSFISLKKILAAVIKCLQPGFEIVALVKPQFEAGRRQVGSGGVVRDPAVHRRVLDDIWSFAGEQGCRVCGLTDSGTPGPNGNIEYLLWLRDAAGEGCRQPERGEAIEAALAALEGAEGPKRRDGSGM